MVRQEFTNVRYAQVCARALFNEGGPFTMRALFVAFLEAVAFVTTVIAADTLTSDFLAPPEVVRLADAYVTSLPQQESAAHAKEIRNDFTTRFFRGFINPDGSISGGTSAGRAGFNAGQQYRRSNPDKLKQTMEGFGYAATNAQGIWAVGFEHSGFRPDGHSGREWWLAPLPVAGAAGAVDHLVPRQGGRVRISGFLSPRGQYGHLGTYEHEFFATNISLINFGRPDGAANRSQPVRRETNQTSGAAGSAR